MPRPKADRKPARPSAPKSIDFPIDKLPAELVQMICLYLKPTELANLRFVSRLVATIALQYMVPEAHLILAKDSFEQLKALAEHPLASKYVTSFFFEADKLGVLPREHWEHIVAGPQYVARVAELRTRGQPCHHATERTLRTFNREVSKLSAAPRHQYTEEQMELAYGKYSDFVRFQQDLQGVAVQEKEVVEAIKHFPHLKELTMATQCSTRTGTSRLRKMFEQAFCTYYEVGVPRDNKWEPLGLQQMRSLLLGAYHAGLKVETLQCGVVNWQILKQDTETFARMRDSVSNVKKLRLEFSTGHAEYDDPWTEFEIESCSSYLEAGRLREFVTAAPALEHLQIGFESNEIIWPTHLKYIVGEHHWPSLKTVKLKMIGTCENDLVAFCARHASTLKSLQLANMGLVAGDWFSAFNKMRKVLTLDTMVVSGRLEALSGVLDFDMSAEEYCPELKEGIEEFFLANDDLSLDDFLDGFLEDTDDDFWSDLGSDSWSEDDVW